MVRPDPSLHRAGGNDRDPTSATNRGTVPNGIDKVFDRMVLVPMPMFGCPSDPLANTAGTGTVFVGGGAGQTAKGGLGSYVGITGNNETGYFDGTNGIFSTLGRGVALTGITDGTSNTLAVAERPPAADTSWGCGDTPTSTAACRTPTAPSWTRTAARRCQGTSGRTR